MTMNGPVKLVDGEAKNNASERFIKREGLK